MLHRAVLGSLERFIALYVEVTAGDFPFWLAPVQVRVLPITERHLAYGRTVREALARAGIRAELDERNEKLGFKIREAELHKVPVMLVVGDQERESGTVTPRRRRAAGRAEGAVELGAIVAELVEDDRERRSGRPSQEG
jgi:threonyl-tRNA synthetase